MTSIEEVVQLGMFCTECPYYNKCKMECKEVKEEKDEIILNNYKMIYNRRSQMLVERQRLIE